MTREQELAGIARGVIDASAYMTLATADAAGQPWACPVWYAPAGYTEFYWVSSPEATHSQNLAARGQLGIVIFDSRAAVGATQAVYMAATAEELTDDDLVQGMRSSRATRRLEPIGPACGPSRTYARLRSIVCTE